MFPIAATPFFIPTNWRRDTIYPHSCLHCYFLNNVLLYICTPHFDYLFIRHLGCFYLSAIMNNVAINMSRQISETLLLIPLGTYPEVELLDHMVILFLLFWGTALLSSMAAVPFYTPTSNTQVFQFFHVLTNTYYFLFFWVLSICLSQFI